MNNEAKIFTFTKSIPVIAVQWFPGVKARRVYEEKDKDGNIYGIFEGDRGDIRIEPGTWVVDYAEGAPAITGVWYDETFRRNFKPLYEE